MQATSTRTGKRCVLNVATDRYVGLQMRLVASLRSVDYRGGLLTWTDTLPPHSPSHAEAPYAFKLFAVREALRQGYSTLLWLDSPCVAAGPLDPVFDRIEKEGHCFVAGEDRLGNWVSDECLEAFGLSRDAALTLKLMNGTFIGLDLSHARTRRWLEDMERFCADGLFRGAYLSEHAPAPIRARKPGKPVGPVSRDPRCWGHRHDESVGSCLAWRHGLALSPLGELFATGGPSTAPVRSVDA